MCQWDGGLTQSHEDESHGDGGVGTPRGRAKGTRQGDGGVGTHNTSTMLESIFPDVYDNMTAISIPPIFQI